MNGRSSLSPFGSHYCCCVRPIHLARPGSPPILSRELAEETIERIPNGKLVDVPGNHITYLFDESATLAADAIAEFVLEKEVDLQSPESA